MDYIYFLEDVANKHILNKNELDDNIFYILCYHVETQCKYPFLQFMMEKIPFCNNLIKEELVLPHIINNNNQKIEELALEKVKSNLHSITNNITDDMYKGVICCNNNWYILINISDIDLCGLFLSRNSSFWFVLPTEIINTKEVCGIDINAEITSLFIDNPRLGILTNPKTKGIYILPDAVYTGGDYKSVEFKAIFGNRKTNPYNSSNKYFYFYRTFLDALTNEIAGVNRYALFLEGELYMELDKEFSLTDEQIEKMYPESCIIICYSKKHYVNVKPDILVKEYDNFVPISYHMIDKSKMEICENEKRII